MAKKVENKELKTPQEICLLLNLNSNSRDYVLYKYKDKQYTESEWKNLFKKDGLNF